MKRAFIHGNVLDVLEKKILENCTVLTEDGIITGIGKDLEVSDAEIVDLKGAYISPGLFNLHVHLTSNPNMDPILHVNDSPFQWTLHALENAEQLVKTGVTYIRDVGSVHNIAVELMQEVEKGRVKMCPDIEAASQPICMTGGTTWQFAGYEADGVDEVRKAARLMLRNGARVIKLFATGGVVTHGSEPGAPQLGEDELRVAVEEAHKAGFKAVCHAEALAGTKNAIRAGVDSIEHGDVLDDEAIQMMLEKGIFLDGTVAACFSIMKRMDDPEFIRKCEECIAVCLDSFTKAYNAGVVCTLGSDCGTPGCMFDESGLELVVMVEKCGVDTFSAMQIGTINSALACSLEDSLGSITVGKKAHFAVFEKSPIEDINNIMDCAMTVKNGEVLWSKL